MIRPREPQILCRPREGRKINPSFLFLEEQLLPLQYGWAGRYAVAVKGTEEEQKSDKGKRRTRAGRCEGVVLVRAMTEIRVQQSHSPRLVCGAVHSSYMQ